MTVRRTNRGGLERFAKGCAAGLERECIQGAMRFRSEMVRSFVPYRMIGPAQGLRSRTGQTRRSITFAKLDAPRVGAKTFTREPHATIQEFGGVVVPKTRRYLTVPLPQALTASGALKGGMMLVRSGPRSWRTADGDRTFIRKGVIFVQKVNAQGFRTAPIPIYVLKRSVRLRPRFGWRARFEVEQRDTRRRMAEVIRAERAKQRAKAGG